MSNQQRLSDLVELVLMDVGDSQAKVVITVEGVPELENIRYCTSLDAGEAKEPE